MADRIIEVPGHGKVAFPENMSDDDIVSAIQKNMIAPSKPSNLKILNEALKYGSPLGLITNLGMEGMKRGGEELAKAAHDAGGKVAEVTGKVLPAEVAGGLGVATNMGVNAIPVLAGGGLGTKAAPLLESGARRLMQSALKPTLADLKGGKADRAITTLLEEGINPTRGGVEKLDMRISDLNKEVTQMIANSPNSIDAYKVWKPVREKLDYFSKQPRPQQDVEAIRKAWNEFMENPLIKSGGVLPVQAAHEMKTVGQQLLSKKYGQMGTADIEAEKAISRGLKNEVGKAEPSVLPLLSKESELINAKKVAERRALMEGNTNIMSLAPLANGMPGFLAFLADKYGLSKSLLARMMHSGQSEIPTAIGAGVGGLGALTQQRNSP